MASWVEAVTKAIRRHVAETGSTRFTRQAFIDAQLSAIVSETGTSGITPAQTLGRELQQLRDAGLVGFEAPGVYRWLGDDIAAEPATPSNAIFVLAARADRDTLPERGFVFGSEWLRRAQRSTGQWVIYQGVGGYGAAARVVDVADADRLGLAIAHIEPGSYMEFGTVVPLEHAGHPIERGLSDANGRVDTSLASRPVRILSYEDYQRILARGLVDDDDFLPREDDGRRSAVQEEHVPWEGPVDRTTMLVERTVRDRQFRKRVLGAYGEQCALTGLRLINGGGRAEVQAAHIQSVEARGPDSINNGIALSGTVHWMFDRGLISLSDAGDILLSRAINDRDSVERLIYRDRKARFPKSAAQRPHPAYLHWHRTVCFHD